MSWEEEYISENVKEVGYFGAKKSCPCQLEPGEVVELTTTHTPTEIGCLCLAFYMVCAGCWISKHTWSFPIRPDMQVARSRISGQPVLFMQHIAGYSPSTLAYVWNFQSDLLSPLFLPYGG